MNFIDKNPVFEVLKIKLEEEIVSELQQFSFNKKTRKENTLYHYTDLNGLKGIVENQCFFSSNSAYLNDKEEFFYGLKLFKTAISNYTSTSNEEEEIIAKINEVISNKLDSYHFVTCFSLEGDILSQWRAYANDGKGIAIGFDLNKLTESIKPKATGIRIIYNDGEQKEITKKIVDITIQFYKSQLSVLESLNQIELYTVIAQEANEIFNKYIAQFKHRSFEEEKEYRLDLSIDIDLNKNRELSYRVGRNNLLVPYLFLKTNFQEELEQKKSNSEESEESIIKKIKYKVKALPIKEIIIGPSLDYDLNKKSIIGFLKKNGYSKNIDIKQSSVPYRI